MDVLAFASSGQRASATHAEGGDMDTHLTRKELTSAEQIIHLGEVIARAGISTVSVDLLLVAHDARDAGVEAVLIEAMIDESMPEVVRERAFSLVGSRLVRLASTGGAKPTPAGPSASVSGLAASAA